MAITGPYARMVWVDDEHPPDESPAPNNTDLADEDGVCAIHELANATLRLQFAPRRAGFEAFEEPMSIWSAIAPLYPKVRISAFDLYRVANDLLPLMKYLAGPAQREELLLEASFMLNGDYKASLWELDLDPERAFAITSQVFLSRYVGVLRFKVGASWFADVLCDTTDLYRDAPTWGAVLAIIPATPKHVENVQAHTTGHTPHVTVL